MHAGRCVPKRYFPIFELLFILKEDAISLMGSSWAGSKIRRRVWVNCICRDGISSKSRS